MRALFSYGLALVLIIAAALWLGTGNLIVGGNGPGKGETPIVAFVDGQDDGPLKHQLEDAGVLADVEHVEGAPDPHLTIAERLAQVSGTDAPARSVRVTTYVAKAMPIQVPLRGRTKAKATVTAAAETTGIVASVEVTKGQVVKSGDLLCTLDQGTRQASVLQAEATLAQAQSGIVKAQADFDTNAALVKKGLAADNTQRPFEVALSSGQAQVSAAQAGLDNANAELERTKIFAKSAGVVQDPLATVGSMLAAGGPCATIVQLDPIVFVGNVPEARIGLAKLGVEATVKTITGATAEGKVTFIASTADAATRSFPVEIEIPNPDGKLLDGITAEATVNLGTAPAHLLPQSVLTLDDSGTLGVRAVKDKVVEFLPVTIVSDTTQGVWVTGLPLTLDVITLGQEYVQDGQTVDPTQSDDDPAAAGDGTTTDTPSTTEKGTPA